MPAPARKPGPASEANAVIKRSIGAAGFRPVHQHTTLGSRPAPGTPSEKRSAGGTRRAASMQDTLSERTARAAQLAPSAVTASAVGGSATRSVVAESLRRRAARRGARAIARRGGSRRVCSVAVSPDTPTTACTPQET
eukprot:scaffold26100_cov30-Phaeocystis_antarctica.AAC.1